MNKITILDKSFNPYIDSQKIAKRVKEIADELNHDLKNKDVIFISILNGAFMFTTDLLKNINLNCIVSFVKLSSYNGDQTTGIVNELIGINEDLAAKTIVVVEDIIDTGNSLNYVLKKLKKIQPKEIKIVSLLFKPDAYQHDYTIDYIGFVIPNDFIVGYGLDYNGFGRNLNEIYTMVKTK